MVIATEKVDVLIRHGGAVACQGGDGIILIERTDNDCFYDSDIWAVVENLDYSMSVVHVGDHP